MKHAQQNRAFIIGTSVARFKNEIRGFFSCHLADSQGVFRIRYSMPENELCHMDEIRRRITSEMTASHWRVLDVRQIPDSHRSEVNDYVVEVSFEANEPQSST